MVSADAAGVVVVVSDGISHVWPHSAANAIGVITSSAPLASLSNDVMSVLTSSVFPFLIA